MTTVKLSPGVVLNVPYERPPPPPPAPPLLSPVPAEPPPEPTHTTESPVTPAGTVKDPDEVNTCCPAAATELEPNPKPLAEPPPIVDNIGNIKSPYANLVWDAKTVNVASAVLIIVKP